MSLQMLSWHVFTGNNSLALGPPRMLRMTIFILYYIPWSIFIIYSVWVNKELIGSDFRKSCTTKSTIILQLLTRIRE